MKNILIINAHPDKESYCNALAQAYKSGVDTTDCRCELINLADLNFLINLPRGYRVPTELEPDLLKMQERIRWADHLVFVYPNWWGTYPALLKGFIDRTFLPGFAFQYRQNSIMWDKLLKGKTARLIVTMDTPGWFYNCFMKAPGHRSMKKGILGFSGIAPVKITTFAPIKTSTEEKRKLWLQQVEGMGRKGV